MFLVEAVSHDTAISGTDYLDLRNRDNFCSVCVGKHVTVSRYCRFCARLGDGRSTVGSGAGRGTKPWQDNWKELMGTQQWDHGLDRIHLYGNIGVHIQTVETRSSALAGDLIVAENRQGRWLLRQLKGESLIAAEVVMDDAMVQDDRIDFDVKELDRCWEVTQDQDKASKVEKAFFETQWGVKMETTFMSYVARRKLSCQQLENALGTSLPTVIKGYATLRDAKLAESSYDKVLMWTGGSYDYDDVVQALVRLDRLEMRPGTSGQSGKTVPTYFTDPEVDASKIAPGSEFWTQPSMDRPHWNEVFDALHEDVDFCDDGETTIARDGAHSGRCLHYRRWSGGS